MKKNILLIFFFIIGIIIIFNFRGHNQNKAIEACIAGSKKLDQPMTVEEAREFCKVKIHLDIFWCMDYQKEISLLPSQKS